MHTAWIVGAHQMQSRRTRARLERSELKILAKGDSWFSTGSFPVCNLLQQMAFSRSACIVNLAIPGDPVAAMSQRIESGEDEFSRQVGAPGARRWDAILLSGGGNDLIDALPHLLREEVESERASDYVDPKALQGLEQSIRASYSRIVAFRDRAGSPNRGVPIFVHTYDYTAPSGAPARLYNLLAISGPWLSPCMQGVPRHLWTALSNYLLDRIAQTLCSLAQALPGFIVVDTRGTLCAVGHETTRRCGDWENEIHPSRAGYRKLAPRFAAVVDQHLCSRSAAAGTLEGALPASQPQANGRRIGANMRRMLRARVQAAVLPSTP